MADAAAVQPAPVMRGWRGFLRTIGGAPALGGLVAATAVGFWIGVAPPAAMPDIAAQLLTADTALTLSEDDTAPDLTAFGWDPDLTAFGWEIEEG